MVDFLWDAFYSILRLVTEGRYPVTNGKIYLWVFAFFCKADILSWCVISASVLYYLPVLGYRDNLLHVAFWQN